MIFRLCPRCRSVSHEKTEAESLALAAGVPVETTSVVELCVGCLRAMNPRARSSRR